MNTFRERKPIDFVRTENPIRAAANRRVNPVKSLNRRYLLPMLPVQLRSSLPAKVGQPRSCDGQMDTRTPELREKSTSLIVHTLHTPPTFLVPESGQGVGVEGVRELWSRPAHLT